MDIEGDRSVLFSEALMRPAGAWGALAFSLTACTLVVDRGRFEDGSGGSSGAATPQTIASSSTTSSASDASVSSSEAASSSAASSSGGGGSAPQCVVPYAFHVSFDDDTNFDGALAKVGAPGALVPSPTSAGPGAWRVALAGDDVSSSLRTRAAHEDEDWWFGFSQKLESAGTSPGSSVLRVNCDVAPSLGYVHEIFTLGIREGSRSQPFEGSTDGPTAVPTVDQLELVPAPAGFANWALHLKPTRASSAEQGTVELYLDGQLRYWLDGPNMIDECNDIIYIDVGPSRYEPPQSPWAVIEDEITLIKGPPSGFTQDDVLFTLAPGNCPFM